MHKFVVRTGICRFVIAADNPRSAIAELKKRIEARAQQHKNPDIGLSLVHALAAGRLNFLVFDEATYTPIAGEYAGIYQDPPSPRLLLSFAQFLQLHLVRRARAALHDELNS